MDPGRLCLTLFCVQEQQQHKSERTHHRKDGNGPRPEMGGHSSGRNDQSTDRPTNRNQRKTSRDHDLDGKGNQDGKGPLQKYRENQPKPKRDKKPDATGTDRPAADQRPDQYRSEKGAKGSKVDEKRNKHDRGDRGGDHDHRPARDQKPPVNPNRPLRNESRDEDEQPRPTKRNRKEEKLKKDFSASSTDENKQHDNDQRRKQTFQRDRRGTDRAGIRKNDRTKRKSDRYRQNSTNSGKWAIAQTNTTTP